MSKFGYMAEGELNSNYLLELTREYLNQLLISNDTNGIIEDDYKIEPNANKFVQGVSACATCDGFFYRKQDVAVVGGGDTACEEATYLASICKQVYLIVRKPFLRASKAMQERVPQILQEKTLSWLCFCS